MGGIVNGTVTECVVSEADGINIGDYVQLVESTGTRSENSASCINDWMYGPFLLSDGTIAVVYYNSSGLQIRRTIVGIPGFINESILMTIDTSPLGVLSPSSVSADNVYVIELEQDKLLLQISDGSQGGFAVLQYSEETWSITALSLQNFTLPTSSGYLSNAKLGRISSSKIILAYNRNLYIAELSGSTLNFGSVCTVTSENPVPMLVEYVNGYAVVVWYEEVFVYSLSALNAINVSSYSIDVLASRFTASKLGTNKIIIFQGTSTSGYFINPSGYIYSTIISIDTDGLISISKNTMAAHYDYTYPNTSMISQACPYVFADGRILIVALMISRSGTSTYSYQASSVFAAVGRYDDLTNSVEFNELELISSKPLNSNTQYGEKQFVLTPIETATGLIYFVSGASTSSGRNTYQFITKIEQTSIVSISEFPIVKKYSTRINGVAKSAGENNSIIEVYAPLPL